MQLLLPIILLLTLCVAAHTLDEEHMIINNKQYDTSPPPKIDFVHLHHRQARSISAVKAVSTRNNIYRPIVLTTHVY
jgi:hypothetical protein